MKNLRQRKFKTFKKCKRPKMKRNKKKLKYDKGRYRNLR